MISSKRRDYLLASLIALPGFGFAIVNSTAEAPDAASSTTAVAAVVLSSAVAAGVVLKPSKQSYAVAFAWSAFSVVFELVQAKAHHDNGSDSRALLSLGLGAVRSAGVVLSARGLKKRS